MFDITELDEMVCALLDPSSLAKCAQVSKKWSRVFAPYVWKNIPKTVTQKGWCEFRELVLEDYQQEQQRQEQQQQPQQQPPPKRVRKSKSTYVAKPISHTSEPTESSAPLALTKFGRLVRHVEEFAELLMGLEPPLPGGGKLSSKEHSDPSAPDLARHFLKRCPNALLDLQVDYEHVKSKKMFTVVLEAIPRVDNLTIRGKYDGRKPFPDSSFQKILLATSDRLRSLTIDIPRFRLTKGADIIGSPNVRDLEITARPKTLKLITLAEINLCADWSWIWRACGQVEKIEISGISQQLVKDLAKGIRDSMPCVDTVVFGKGFPGYGNALCAANLPSILSASTNGWKAVHCGYSSQWQSSAFDALLQHASPLEELSIVNVRDRGGIPRVLKSCPNLRKLVTIDDGRHGSSEFAEVDAQDFIDWDPARNAVQPWVSAANLETLAIKVTGILPQGSNELPVDFQRFYETQQRICERLGEFKALKVLTLGHRAIVAERRSVWLNRWRTGYRTTISTSPMQGECLHLTLAMGLDRMGGFKNLEELHIPNMDHHVTVKEDVEWMVDNWPKISRVRGLGVVTEARKWLKETHPEIQLE
ncbi:hypothetical protein BG006_008422 [Podila minutissima]|uniref:F-box domain-containing protein n=1 Tax=Podila minutissima TaxID=64525 RepID=A0A9P5STP5_9FUNG|nr:hypothetical protein BG006_008422 [Podila minutissima]